ncbi:MAG: DUF4019 domain-containing protein [Bryobacteraceae bacterium]
MKTALRFALSVILIATFSFAAAPQSQAQSSGEAWLSLIDGGKYDQSWAQSATLFRTQVPQQKWAEMVGAVRGPMGALKSRKLKNITFAKALPGVPDGNYAVIQFDTVFGNKAVAVETLTVADDNGQWRAAGYFIK